MFGATKVGNQRSSPDATSTDFCQIFETDMNRLYRLSFLLTGDEPTAEQCFLGGLQMAQEGNSVFKNWAEAWARRMIILDSIRVLHPQLIGDTSQSVGRVAGDRETDRIEIAEIVKLPVFERFVFVISVLEGYSDHECSLHLGCPRAAVVAARVRALARIGRAAELRDKLVSIASARIKSSDTRNDFSYETINDICHDSGCR
jgi:DNA-directed RNA polymerase specialized sigma24 family protein